jgi:hypothetical protein
VGATEPIILEITEHKRGYLKTDSLFYVCTGYIFSCFCPEQFFREVKGGEDLQAAGF